MLICKNFDDNKCSKEETMKSGEKKILYCMHGSQHLQYGCIKKEKCFSGLVSCCEEVECESEKPN